LLLRISVMQGDPYQILGLKPGATDDDIRIAFRALAKQHHPDMNPGNKDSEDRFKEITTAHDLLIGKNIESDPREFNLSDSRSYAAELERRLRERRRREGYVPPLNSFSAKFKGFLKNLRRSD
jgi:curved DNA-binding protein CbpA